MSSRVLTLTALIAVALIATGCSVRTDVPGASASPGDRGVVTTAPAPATPEPTPTLTRLADPVDADCVDGILSISGSGQELTYRGVCERVEVSGNDLDLDLDDADVNEIVVRGDRNEVDLAAVGALELEGQTNEVDARSIGSLVIRGDRNEIDVDDELGAATVSGFDNVVEAQTLGAVDDSGERNEFRRD